MNFCSHCGARVVLRVPPGDTVARYVCERCETIHYRNPLIVVGAIPEIDGRLLLCRRAIEPRLGFWTLPAGFMELGETAEQGAARETLEEANARIEVGEVFSLLSVPHVNQVHIFYRARLLDMDGGPGTESLEVALFKESEVPWSELAFRSITRTLQHYYADARTGRFGVQAEAIGSPPPG
jgi:ADP-ribose pyrophosphatase YjhB (NUDIX family)